MATIIESEAPGGYEQRYGISLGGGAPMRFVRRPVSIEPKDGTVCFVDNGPRTGTIPRYAGAAFKDGRWQGVKFEPTHWTHWDTSDE